jgi:hypothetical protein
MSQQTSVLSEVRSGDPISPGTLAYLGERARNRYYDFVLKRFRASGLTKADLARRIGKGQDRINHLLGAPGNWTIDTIAELLAGVSQEELRPDAEKLGLRPAKNITQADLLARNGRRQPGGRRVTPIEGDVISIRHFVVPSSPPATRVEACVH